MILNVGPMQGEAFLREYRYFAVNRMLDEEQWKSIYEGN